ncbi:hypothetical protein DKK68_01135 [Bifidobacterium asteroides]|nr:hypothetical protein DKK68_01135 [Bifidobacterium asteroides]
MLGTMLQIFRGVSMPIIDIINLIINSTTAIATVVAIPATIVYSARQTRRTFAKDDERRSYDLYQTMLKQASRVDVWESKTSWKDKQKEGSDEHLIITNHSEGTIRQVSILVHWDLLKNSHLRPIKLKNNTINYYRVPGFGHHHAWRTLPTADWIISMDPDSRFTWSLPTICPGNIFESPRFLDKNDPQDRCRLNAVAIKFTDVYGNIWERLFESEYLPKDHAAGLHLLYSPDDRLAEFCKPKGVIPE